MGEFLEAKSSEDIANEGFAATWRAAGGERVGGRHCFVARIPVFLSSS
jgi:hypothetical protein